MSDTNPQLTKDKAHHDAVFGRCPHCSMQLRRDEMDVHLAHAHNIGPVVKKDKGKDGRGRRRERE